MACHTENMPPNVTFMVKGQPIAQGFTTLKADSRLRSESFKAIGTLEGSFTLEDCEINPEMLWVPLYGPMDITVSKGEYLPPRQLRSKKKRIVNKWKKLYTFNKETTTYKNCAITGLEEE